MSVTSCHCQLLISVLWPALRVYAELTLHYLLRIASGLMSVTNGCGYPPCRVYAELTLHYLLRIASGLLRRPLTEEGIRREGLHIHATLPRPMVRTMPEAFTDEGTRAAGRSRIPVG